MSPLPPGPVARPAAARSTGARGLRAYRDFGGYQPLISADELLAEVERSGLLAAAVRPSPCSEAARGARQRTTQRPRRGRGRQRRRRGAASIKDRWLLRHRPHLILDGLRLAAAIVAADRAYVYVSDPESSRSIETALTELDTDALGVPVQVWMVEPGYVAGEETAAVRALNGGPVKPTDKPPRPFEEGVGGRPTLVSNVETLANLAYLQRHGSAEFRAQGTPMSPGTFLLTLTGAGGRRASTSYPWACLSPRYLRCMAFRPNRCRVC
ncbi:respiratory-chain NADH dehydrogenase 51 Kd subunit [Mycobacterium xenopi 3993]|nr:respiratory-chain NADH dehydrogenase 51 Kd subunit [Mycobacterium xenopi 3993]